MPRASQKRSASRVAAKISSRGKKGPARQAKLGLKLLYAAPQLFQVTGLPRGDAASIAWDEHDQKWKLSHNGIIHPLTTFFLSPKTAKEDKARFMREALSRITPIVRGESSRLPNQKGPLALGVQA